MNQSKRWTRALLYVGTLPIDALWGWPLVLAAHLFWGEDGALRREDGALRTRARASSWLHLRYGQRWAGVTLSPHAIVYLAHPLWPEDLEEPGELQRHEHVHVEQGEAACLAGLVDALLIFAVVALAGSPIVGAVLGLLKWLLASHEKTAAANLAALLRGEDGYRGSHVEEAAYARQGDP